MIFNLSFFEEDKYLVLLSDDLVKVPMAPKAYFSYCSIYVIVVDIVFPYEVIQDKTALQFLLFEILTVITLLH